ncbi:MAG: hypothetical protein DMF54_13130 [Acidobacteria bacterium]|nr:MAG: hypothetical protein DMF55_04495 [Acidobacteriota bacterium]PYQ64746.1 MAG: hypothetical protein DMF54_13130 [Acidobacteriota bacterium]
MRVLPAERIPSSLPDRTDSFLFAPPTGLPALTRAKAFRHRGSVKRRARHASRERSHLEKQEVPMENA